MEVKRAPQNSPKQPLGELGVPGQRELQKRLADTLRSGRRHHALILGGPAGETMSALAKNLAKGLLCPVAGATVFCGNCSSCRRIENDLYPDVFTVKEEGTEPLKIDVIREVCHQMEISPLEGVAKVCIIEACHRMTAASANAFLKTLEEPRPNRYFLLLTSQPAAVLPTILSRCLSFHALPEDPISDDSETYEAWLDEARRSGSANGLVAKLEDKEVCLAFVKHLQGKFRDKVIAHTGEKADSEALFPAMVQYEQSVQLEGRLRSNANYGLLVENFLRRYWIRPPLAAE